MRYLSGLIVALAFSTPAQAEEETMAELFKQFEELSENAQTLLEGWVEELGPKLEELGPTLESFAEKLDDMTAYHPPEVLENGDIIIRRKKPLESKPEPKARPVDETIDL